eukprot:3880431-Rhodomonas_salina.1
MNLKIAEGSLKRCQFPPPAAGFGVDYRVPGLVIRNRIPEFRGLVGLGSVDPTHRNSYPSILRKDSTVGRLFRNITVPVPPSREFPGSLKFRISRFLLSNDPLRKRVFSSGLENSLREAWRYGGINTLYPVSNNSRTSGWLAACWVCFQLIMMRASRSENTPLQSRKSALSSTSSTGIPS